MHMMVQIVAHQFPNVNPFQARVLLVGHKPRLGLDVHHRLLRGESWYVFIDEILPRHEVARPEVLAEYIPRIKFLLRVPVAVSMQNER